MKADLLKNSITGFCLLIASPNDMAEHLECNAAAFRLSARCAPSIRHALTC
jgi:hypothetical protein